MPNFLKAAILSGFFAILWFGILKKRLGAIRPRFLLPNRQFAAWPLAPRFASRSGRIAIVVLASALLPACWRLPFLPWRPAPEPLVHDEFSHLLVADTLLAHRLANAPHKLAAHLDTIYVLQHPAYASIYPIGQGAILAVGRIIAGNPWFGIVLATMSMCGAIAWALSELLPLPYAAIGGLIVAFTYGLEWLDSYWGGAFCGFGGALMFGSVLRLRRSSSILLAGLAAFGWCVTWFTRPFESVLLFGFLWASVGALAIRSGRAWKSWILPAAVVALIQICAGSLTLLHNRSVTGSPLTLPYQLSQRIDGVPQSFVWQMAIPPPRFRFRELQEMYYWQLERKDRPLSARVRSFPLESEGFYLKIWFFFPFFLALFAARERIVLIGWILLALASAASLLYPFFFPHYIAAYATVFAYLITRGMLTLRGWTFRGTPIGQYTVAFLALGGLFSQPIATTSAADLLHKPLQKNTRRHICDRVAVQGGKSVIFVRYAPDHSMRNEWVYNRADVDASSIVWCRWLGSQRDREVALYYPDRKYWIVDVDGTGLATNLSSYDP